MERVTSVANAAAETVKGAIWGPGDQTHDNTTQRSDTMGGATGSAHRAGDYPSNQEPMRVGGGGGGGGGGLSGQHPSTVRDVERMEGGGKMPGAFGSDHSAGSTSTTQGQGVASYLPASMTGLAQKVGLTSLQDTSPQDTSPQDSTTQRDEGTGAGITGGGLTGGENEIDFDRNTTGLDHDPTTTHHDTTHHDTTRHDTTHHDTALNHQQHRGPGADISSGIIGATAATGLASDKDTTTRHDAGYPTVLSSGSGPGANTNPFKSEHTEVYRSDRDHDHDHHTHGHDHSKGGVGFPSDTHSRSLHHKDDSPDLRSQADRQRDHSTTTSTNPFKSSTTAPTTNTNTTPPHHSPPLAASTESGDYHGVDAPPGPTRTEVSTREQGPHSSPFQAAGMSAQPPPPHSHTAGLSRGAGDDTSAGKSALPGAQHSPQPNTLTGGTHGGPGAQVQSSGGALPGPGHGTAAEHHQGSHQPIAAPSHRGSGNAPIGTHRKSIPLVEGHPESDGPRTHPTEKLPSAPGTGQGTGEKHVRSSGVVAEGGDFDAAAPGAGREADRLMDEYGVHHGANVKHSADTTATHKTTSPGKPSIGLDTAGRNPHATDASHQSHSPTSTTAKPSLGGKIKEKLHLGHH